MNSAAKNAKVQPIKVDLGPIFDQCKRQGSADPLTTDGVMEYLARLSTTDFMRLEPQLKETLKGTGVNWWSFYNSVKEWRKRLTTGNTSSQAAARENLAEQLRAAIQGQFEVIGFVQLDDAIALKIFLKRHRMVTTLRLTSPRAIPPLLSLEGGRLMNWMRESGVEIPEDMLLMNTNTGTRRKTEAELEEELSYELHRVFLDLAREASPFENLKLLADGLHYRNGELIWVDRNNWWVRSPKGEWYDWSQATFRNRFFLVGSDAWTECRPIDESPYTPGQVYQAMVELFENHWTFENAVDPRILALSLMKAVVCDLFQRMEQIHIIGSKQSGKSRLPKLVMGLLGVLPRLVECAWYSTDLTNPSMVREFQGRRGLLLLDEFERGYRRDAILDTLRSAMDVEAGPKRAAGDGTVERVVRLPVWMISVDALDRDTDQDRVIEIRIPKVERAQAPDVLIRQSGWMEKWDTDKLRRSLTICLMPYVDQLREAYVNLQMRTLPGEELVEYRFKEGLLGMLAVAQIAGEDVDRLAERIFRAKAPARQLAKETSQEDTLLEAILDTPFELEDPMTGRRRYTSVRALIVDGEEKVVEQFEEQLDGKKARKKKDNDWLVYLPYPGFAFDPASQTLYLNWQCIRSAYLHKTDFRNTHERELINLLSRLKGRGVFLGSRADTIRGLRKNYTMLNLKDLL